MLSTNIDAGTRGHWGHMPLDFAVNKISPAWRSCGVTRLQTLQKLQNRAARIVTRSNFDSSAKPLIHNLEWPTINDIIRSETATIMYKSLHGLAPEYLSKRFINNSTRSIRQL